MADRCKHDMLPGQCGDCRGLKTPEEQAAADRLAVRQRLLNPPHGTVKAWFKASFPGACHKCGDRFPEDAAIRRAPGATGYVYIAECCAEEDNRG